ncbi:MAG TPA: ribose 5-phosphate isomerase B [Aggregatilineales bacterium]|nr:ribose 5-phosphate isomerase B [Aggregatilineales bacterium]
MMKVALGADHAGYELKQSLLAFLNKQGYEVLDVGTDTAEVPSDYPEFSKRIAEAVLSGKAERGILVCGSGVGASIAANKIRGIYAGLCHDTYSAHQGVEHDNMNVICVGSRVIGVELAREIAQAFLKAKFSGEERHVRRFAEVKAIEAQNLQLPTPGPAVSRK